MAVGGTRKDSSKAKRNGIARRAREQKREEALLRQMDRDARTTEQQLALIDARPGKSARERARLTASKPS